MDIIKAKIYFDGGHWIAIRPTKRPSKRKNRQTVLTDEEAQTLEKFEKAFKKAKGRTYHKKERLLKEFSPLFEDKGEAAEFVEQNFERLNRNKIERLKRLKRKSYLQRWSYFATFTYADSKQNETTFRKRLMTCLSHLANRNGWKYIGIWERGGENNRLHFHAIVYIPPNGMVGELVEHNDFNAVTHRREKNIQNTFFSERFGRNDFSAITNQFEVNDSVKYMLKYIAKSDEKIVYSRGLKTYLISDVMDCDVICQYDEENDTKFVLNDKFTCIVDGEIIGQVSPEIIEQMPKSN